MHEFPFTRKDLLSSRICDFVSNNLDACLSLLNILDSSFVHAYFPKQQESD